MVMETGDKNRIRAESFADHYSQARQFYRSQTPHEQTHIASALVFELSKVERVLVRQAMVGHLRHVDEDLARRVADGLALRSLPDAPKTARPVQDLPCSPALQLIGRMKDTLAGRVVGILVADGSDGAAVEALKSAVSADHANVKIVAPRVGGVTLEDGSLLSADGQLAGTPSVMFDAVAIVLSEQAAQQLCAEAAAIDFVRDAFGHLKALAADRGGEALLRAAGVKTDAGVVAVGDVDRFLTAARTRQWEREQFVRALA